MKDKYVLCYIGKTFNGKKEIYPIYKSSLINIDMYTSYERCFSKKDLFRFLPDNVKRFIDNNFEVGTINFLSGDFFIRKNCKDIRKGRTNLSVLYKCDSDIVYAKQADIKRALEEISLSDDEKNISEVKKEFIKKAYEILLDEKVISKIDFNIERECVYGNRISLIFSIPSNLQIISKYISENYELKRSFLILLKEYKKKIDDLKGTKTWLVDENTLNKRIKERPFSIIKAEEDMSSMLRLQKIYFSSKDPNNSGHESVITQEKPITNVNEDLLNYIKEYESDEVEKIKDDYDDEEEYEFLGPKKPNDPRYWSIN